MGLGLARRRPDLPLGGAVLVPDPLLPSAEVLQALADLLLERLRRPGPLGLPPLGERVVRQRRGGEPEFDAFPARRLHIGEVEPEHRLAGLGAGPPRVARIDGAPTAFGRRLGRAGAAFQREVELAVEVRGAPFRRPVVEQPGDGGGQRDPALGGNLHICVGPRSAALDLHEPETGLDFDHAGAEARGGGPAVDEEDRREGPGAAVRPGRRARCRAHTGRPHRDQAASRSGPAAPAPHREAADRVRGEPVALLPGRYVPQPPDQARQFRRLSGRPCPRPC